MSEQTPPATLEVSKHYLGNEGVAYFQYQKKDVLIGGCIEARKFSPFIGESETVLDFGCGSGAILANLKAARRIGVEPNPAARQFLVETSQGAIQAFASIDEIPDQSVDVVISNHCLEHVPSPVAALRHFFRVLKPGGRTVIYVPIDDWRIQRRYDSADINHHLHTWSPLLFGHTLSEGGFRQIQVDVVTQALPPKYTALYQRLPEWLFDAAAWGTAFLKKRRQIRGMAVRA